ncbi:MAG: DUF4019 domain-containing protein [Xenococcaceae cyanobacterium]
MMKHKTLSILVLTFIGILGLGFPGGCSKEKEPAAVEAAQAWLALVDAEKYSESWETAAEYFKNVVTVQQWEQALTAIRKPLGKVQSRELKSKQFMTELPGAPDGEYVVIQYETSFENKKSAIETITPMLDKDSKWRVAGYYIK